VYAPNRSGFKKSRRTYKRKSMRAKKTADFTSLATRATNTGFRGRKVTRRAFKKHLWDSTLFKPHYRSLITTSSTSTTPLNDVQCNIFGLNMYRHTVDPFWTALGGAIPIDVGVPIPTFTGNIILRGGVYSVTVVNQSTNDLRVNLFMTTSVARPNTALVPANFGSSWDPSCTAGFSAQMAKVYMTKSVIIEGGNSWNFSRRFNIQKIDLDTYANEGLTPFVFLSVTNVGSIVANAFRIVRSYNLSFSGDGQ